MNRNYFTPRIDDEWARSRETHAAVATAIHAIADSTRSPEAIWAAPTSAEWDHVATAVEEYVTHGDFDAEPDGQYSWGQETISAKHARRGYVTVHETGIVLPMGCALGRDDDGAWWIIPPADVLIYSEPGEMVLLDSDTSVDAITEAETYLADVEGN